VLGAGYLLAVNQNGADKSNLLNLTAGNPSSVKVFDRMPRHVIYYGQVDTFFQLMKGNLQLRWGDVEVNFTGQASLVSVSALRGCPNKGCWSGEVSVS